MTVNKTMEGILKAADQCENVRCASLVRLGALRYKQAAWKVEKEGRMAGFAKQCRAQDRASFAQGFAQDDIFSDAARGSASAASLTQFLVGTAGPSVFLFTDLSTRVAMSKSILEQIEASVKAKGAELVKLPVLSSSSSSATSARTASSAWT